MASSRRWLSCHPVDQTICFNDCGKSPYVGLLSFSLSNFLGKLIVNCNVHGFSSRPSTSQVEARGVNGLRRAARGAHICGNSLIGPKFHNSDFTWASWPSHHWQIIHSFNSLFCWQQSKHKSSNSLILLRGPVLQWLVDSPKWNTFPCHHREYGCFAYELNSLK